MSQTADSINEELIRSLAPNQNAITNAKKISNSGGFVSLNQTAEKTLIFGECKGSGKSGYQTSVDFSESAPVFRCSCPSRQFPCKHGLAILYEWINGKTFEIAEVPEDVAKKREKLTKRKEKSKESSGQPSKVSLAAAKKKLQKQLEGLDLAETFVTDLLNRGVSSINGTSSSSYKNLAKQLGDYYLPELQAIMMEIITVAEILSKQPNDTEVNRLVALCVRLSSSVKKSREYIESKLEADNVALEDTILYEAMGGIWKLSQLREIGLYKENARLVQLSFQVIDDEMHQANVETGYWIDLDSGEISRTENIRPYKSAKYIKAEDTSFGVFCIPELYRYPGGLNRRIRWESMEQTDLEHKHYSEIKAKAEESIGAAVKKAKNELKNTLSKEACAMLLPFEQIHFAKEDNHGILEYRGERIALMANENYQDTCKVLSMVPENLLKNGALLGEVFFCDTNRQIYICPLSIVTENDIVALC